MSLNLGLLDFLGTPIYQNIFGLITLIAIPVATGLDSMDIKPIEKIFLKSRNRLQNLLSKVFIINFLTFICFIPIFWNSITLSNSYEKIFLIYVASFLITSLIYAIVKSMYTFFGVKVIFLIRIEEELWQIIKRVDKDTILLFRYTYPNNSSINSNSILFEWTDIKNKHILATTKEPVKFSRIADFTLKHYKKVFSSLIFIYIILIFSLLFSSKSAIVLTILALIYFALYIILLYVMIMKYNYRYKEILD